MWITCLFGLRRSLAIADILRISRRNVDRVKKRFVEEAGGGASSGGFGVEPAVSTCRYRHVDVFVSTRIVPGRIYGGGDGPGALDGWWDFMDPFVEVFHRYVIREGMGQVTGHVAVAGTPNITGPDIGTLSFDSGVDHRLDIQTSWINGILAIVGESRRPQNPCGI